jgi:pantoate--beta-alanine ligase
MRTVHTFTEARLALPGAIALVPTMGSLHEGHLALIEAARAEPVDVVMMSLFVNPLQFDDPLDLDRYPRDLGRDAGLAAAAGVDVLFAPPLEEMYPEDSVTRVSVGRLGSVLEGEHRPGHFDGVATVVTALFAGLRPEVAVFGRKDAQQLAVVRRLVADLSFPTRIVGVSTVREPDGLALSSRNVFIEDRRAALGLVRGLGAAADAWESGERDPVRLEGLVRDSVADRGAAVDYARLVDASTVEGFDGVGTAAFLAVAATVGGVRLIDNLYIEADGSVDRGMRLRHPSALSGGG